MAYPIQDPFLSARRVIPDPPRSGHRPLPDIFGSLEVSLIISIPCGSGNLVAVEESYRYLEELRRMLVGLGGKFEILLAPYGMERSIPAEVLSRLTEATLNRGFFRWIPPQSGPAMAVQESVRRSRGRNILVANLEYAYSTSFFRQALGRLRKGDRLVRANRRLPDSEFNVPVTLLSMVFRRHLWGSLLGRFWTWCFGFPMTDTLSGGFAMERKLALRIFNRLTCPHFLYGAEIAVLAHTNGFPVTDLPVHFRMSKEKSKGRVFLETLEVLVWTWKLRRRLKKGFYRFLEKLGSRLTADDWGLSPGVNEGILELAQAGLIERVSALAGGKYLNYRLKEMKKIQGIEWGLHFNLTQKESGGSFRSPWRFLWVWMTRRARSAGSVLRSVRGAVIVQIRCLWKAGIRPVRLDGHHHVHAAPELLAEVGDILRRSGIKEVRVPYHRALWFGPKAPLALLGLFLRKKVQRSGFRYLPFYYPDPKDLKNLNAFVQAVRRNPRSEVLVHPAQRDDIAQSAPSDTYRSGRVSEFELLTRLSLEIRIGSFRGSSNPRPPRATT